MAYEKQNFKDGQCLCGHHLNHIEEGIAKLEEEIENGGGGSSGGSAYIELIPGENGTTITVTNPDGTGQMATVRNGEDGKNGEPGIVWKGEWNAETSYTSLKNGQLSRDAVYYNGSAYVLKNTVSPVVGVVPEGDTTKWELLAKGGSGSGMFTGSTGDTSPTDVANAMTEGRQILISHMDNTYGIIMFANFTLATMAGIIAASVTFEFGGVLFNASITGDLNNNTWKFDAVEVARLEDIPEEKKTTSVDLSGFESGTVVENFSDGSSLTYSFEFDEDGKITKITDSDGNETVLNW